MSEPRNPGNTGRDSQYAAQDLSDAATVGNLSITPKVKPPGPDMHTYVGRTATKGLCMLHDMHAVGITEDILLGDERITKEFCHKIIEIMANKNAKLTMAIFFATSHYVRNAPFRVHGNIVTMTDVIEKLIECD